MPSNNWAYGRWAVCGSLEAVCLGASKEARYFTPLLPPELGRSLDQTQLFSATAAPHRSLSGFLSNMEGDFSWNGIVSLQCVCIPVDCRLPLSCVDGRSIPTCNKEVLHSLPLLQNNPTAVTWDVYNLAHGRTTHRASHMLLVIGLANAGPPQYSQSRNPSCALRRAGPLLRLTSHSRGRAGLHALACRQAGIVAQHSHDGFVLMFGLPIELLTCFICHACLPQFCNILGNPNTIGEELVRRMQELPIQPLHRPAVNCALSAAHLPCLASSLPHEYRQLRPVGRLLLPRPG